MSHSVFTSRQASAYGRKRTLGYVDFGALERPVLGKADIKPTILPL